MKEEATEAVTTMTAMVTATINAAVARAFFKSFSTEMSLTDPPQAKAPLACLCEKGPRRERLPQAFTAKDCSRPTLALLSSIFLLAVSSGCSPDAEKAGRASPLAGTHIFTCGNGKKVSVEFVGDGLTINLATLPDGKADRLISPAAGVTYFGDYVNLAVSGDAIVTLRADVPSQVCRRDNRKRVGQPPP